MKLQQIPTPGRLSVYGIARDRSPSLLNNCCINGIENMRPYCRIAHLTSTWPRSCKMESTSVRQAFQHPATFVLVQGNGIPCRLPASKAQVS